MRKLLLSSFVALLCVLNMNAQFSYISRFRTDKYQVLDQAQYVVKYQLKSKTFSDQKKYDTTENMLLIGKKVSKFFNPEVLNNQTYFKSGLDAIPNMPSKGLGATEVFQYNGGRQEVVVYGVNSVINAQLYQDQPELKWNITSESKDILGFTCQKATCRFRGRDYVAWFTTQVPLNNGPWKFYGLPGLILKVSDSKGNFIFTATQVNRLKKPMDIVKYDLGGYDKVSRKDANSLIKRYNEDPYSVLKGAAAGTGTIVSKQVMNSDGSFSKGSNLPDKTHYVGLELQ